MKQQEFFQRFDGELRHGIIYYKGNLELEDTSIMSLPDNLTVLGYLNVRDTGMMSLPDNLTVEGSLYFRGTQIKKIPRNLTVKDNLYLRGTQITFLPCDLTVGGNICGFDGDRSQVNRNIDFRKKMLQEKHLTIKKTSPSSLTQGDMVCFDPKGELNKVYINNDSIPCIRHCGVQREIRKDVYKVVSKPLIMGIDIAKDKSDTF